MKQCTKCLETKALSEFSRNGERYHSHCKVCRSAHYKVYAQTDKEKERLRTRTVGKRYDAQEYVRAEKSKPCMDCKKSYPYYVMQFDHLGDKKYNVAWMVSRGYTIASIAEEIAKCDLVCANCHAERTHQRRLDKGEADVL